MDLTERGESATRHPWEVQRFEAYRRVLADHNCLDTQRVLDVGAGDSWFAGRLLSHLPNDSLVTCWDLNYSTEDLGDVADGIVRTVERPSSGHGLVLLLDVLEHIADPAAFMGDELMPIVEAGTSMLVAVPAYQWLFGAHDVALDHHRRYGRQQFLTEIGSWIDVTDTGSLFTSLVLPRATAVGLERLRPQGSDDVGHGVGAWSGGSALTTITNRALAADARFGRFVGRTGFTLPGLSHWAFGVAR